MKAAVAVAVSLSLASVHARAQDADTKGQARALFQEGSAAFHAGDYDRAITLFRRGYDLDPVGAFLLNMAQAYRLKQPRDCAAALRHYELYLVAEPRSPERPEIEAHIASMRSCAAPPPPAPAPAPAPTVATAPRPKAPLWVAASGAALALTGGGLYAAARLRYDDLRPTCPCPDDVIDRWQTTTRVSYGLLAGGALVVSAGLLWWWGGERPAQARASRWYVGPGLVGGTF